MRARALLVAHLEWRVLDVFSLWLSQYPRGTKKADIRAAKLPLKKMWSVTLGQPRLPRIHTG